MRLCRYSTPIAYNLSPLTYNLQPLTYQVTIYQNSNSMGIGTPMSHVMTLDILTT